MILETNSKNKKEISNLNHLKINKMSFKDLILGENYLKQKIKTHYKKNRAVY